MYLEHAFTSKSIVDSKFLKKSDGVLKQTDGGWEIRLYFCDKQEIVDVKRIQTGTP